MSALLAAWLGPMVGSIAAAFFNAFGAAVADMMKTWRFEQVSVELGQTQVERDQALEGERVQRELAEEAAKQVSAEDALKQLELGQA